MYEYLRKFRKHFPNRKFFQLVDKIYEMKNLQEAWRKVKSNSGCAGIDKQTISEFQKQSERYLNEIQRKVKNGTYNPMPTLRKFIPKGKNKVRPLGIPTVKDRVLQQATKNVIEQIFEMKFLDCSYGYRPNRNAQQAVKQIKNYMNHGYKWVIDADVEKFFDSVDHQILMSFVADEISDSKVLNLIESWLKAGVMNQGKKEETPVGTPQGGVVSPLLANIYLHAMDKQIVKIDRVRLVRYADDFVILCKTENDAERTMKQVKEILTGLKLRLNKTKTKIANVNLDSFEFLGFKLERAFGKVFVTPGWKAIKKFKESIRRVTWRKQPVKPEYMIGRLNNIMRGWGNYFKIGNVKELFGILDGWIRTRVRTYIEKRKSKLARTRISNYVLKTEYHLTSLISLLKPHFL
jgi:RNA-directed DNA polymerase